MLHQRPLRDVKLMSRPSGDAQPQFDEEVAETHQVFIEGRPQTLLKLVGSAALLRVWTGQRLHCEDVHFDQFRVIHVGTSGGRGEVLRSNHHWPHTHRAQ